MRRPARATLTAALCLLAACSSTFGRRSGPRFAEAFPDASELVTTSDPRGMRKRLADVRLPDEDAHHEQLRLLLDRQTTIDAAHLLLLVEAVHLPEDALTVYLADGHRLTWTPRGRGRYAPVADQLLLAGLPKLTGVDRRALGELLGRTHADRTLTTLADSLLPPLDDGSTAALREVLEGMGGSPAGDPFLIGYLAPKGLLAPSRGYDLVGALPFDDRRLALARAIAAHTVEVPAERLLQVVAAMTFDDGRMQALQALAGKCPTLPAATAHRLVATFSFDDGRVAACRHLATTGLQLDGPDLVRIVDLMTFDDDRALCVRTLAPRLCNHLQARTASDLLARFTFDDERLAAVRAIRSHLPQLDDAERQQLLDTFTFDDDRAQAARLLRS